MEDNDQKIYDALANSCIGTSNSLQELMQIRNKVSDMMNRFKQLAECTSLRDEIAMRAMVEIIAINMPRSCTAEMIANQAYTMADAMLAARDAK